MKFISAVILALAAVTAAFAQTQQPACPYNYVLALPITSSAQLAINLPTPVAQYRFRICKVIMQVTQGTTAYNFYLAAGTGSVCGTSTVSMTQPYIGNVSSTQIYGTSVDASEVWTAPLGNNLCFFLTGMPVAAYLQIWYGIQTN